jgi:hypothetical protein
LQGGVPLGFQAASDQPVVRVDGQVAAFGLARVVAGLFDLAAVLDQGAVVAVLELPARQTCSAAGASAARNASATAASIANPPTFICRDPRPSTNSAEPWQ